MMLVLTFFAVLLLFVAWDICAEVNLRGGEGEDVPMACGTPDPSYEELVRVETAMQAFKQASPAANALTLEGVETIPVYFHVIASSSGRGNPSSQSLQDQIDALNRNYARTNFRFALGRTDRYTNDNWYGMTPYSSAETDAKHALVVYGAKHLNVYTIGPSGGLGGWSTYPWGFNGNEWKDGVVIAYNTLPGYGGDGVILTHEAGHWLGLYHTFQGGCSGDGDFVSDTSPEASPAYGCDTNRNTCSGAGNDPVQNFMDYSSCRNTFSNGQASRMVDNWNKYRANH